MKGSSLADRAKALFGEGGQGFVPAIQGLRGLAALSVVIVHLYAMPYLAGMVPPSFPEWLHLALVTGGRGVELFFIISGYLIPASLVRHRLVSKFFYDRAMRIMPLFVILHLGLFTVGPLVGYKFFPGLDALGYLRAFLSNLFFVPDLFGDPIGQQNAWTLTYEWAFYIWFAALFASLRRGLWPVALGLVLLALVIAGLYPLVTYFGLGMLMASAPLRLPLRGWAGLGLGLLSLAAMYYACEYITPYVGLVPAAVVFALVLAPESGLARLLQTSPLQFVGKVSYSLYLVHPFVLFPLMAVARRAYSLGFDAWLIMAAFAAIGAAASLIVAAISYELVELRLRRWLHARLGGAHREAAIATASR